MEKLEELWNGLNSLSLPEIIVITLLLFIFLKLSDIVRMLGIRVDQENDKIAREDDD